jgi:hypothetical protein
MAARGSEDLRAFATAAGLFLAFSVAEAQAAGANGSAADGSTGGGMGGGPGAAAGGGRFGQAPDAFGLTSADPKAATRSAELALAHCSGDFADERLCIADALEAYAQALRELSPSLSPPLQGLPEIVSRAAQQVRAAKTRGAAVRAIKIAIGEVRKTISLIRADDLGQFKAETRASAFVAETLEVADNKLEKAVGL